MFLFISVESQVKILVDIVHSTTLQIVKTLIKNKFFTLGRFPIYSFYLLNPSFIQAQ